MSNIEFERERALALAKAKAKVKQREKDLETGPEVDAPSFLEDPVNFSRMMIDGFSMGWDDEAVGFISAVTAKLSGSDTSFDDLYKQGRDLYRQQSKDIKEESPLMATSAQVLGGIATPVPLPAKTLQGALQPAKTLKGMTAQGAAFGATTALGASEEANLADTATGAGLGAGFSLALGGAGKGVSRIWNEASKRRIKENLLKEDGSFTPITLADSNEAEQTAGQYLYKELLGSTLIGGKSFRESERAFISAQEEVVALADKSFKEAQSKAKNALNEAESAAKLAKEEAVGKAAEQKANMLNKAEAQSARIADEAVEESTRAFRRNIIASSIPKGVGEQRIDYLFKTDDVLKTVKRLDNMWQKEGFKAIREANFTVQPEVIKQKLVEAVTKKDGQIYNTNDIQKMADEVFEKFVAGQSATGKVSGDVVANLRGSIGMKLGELGESPEALLRATVMKRLQGVIDNDIILPQLNKKQREEFLGDKESYGVLTTLRDAAMSAGRDSKKQGAFDAQDWLNSATRNSGILTRRGENRFQRPAYALVNNNKQRDEMLKKTADRMKKRAINAERSIIASANKRLSKELERLKKQENLPENNTQVLQKQQELKQNQEYLSKLKNLSSAKDATFLRQLAATGVVGTVATTGVSMLTGLPIYQALPIGMALGKIATTQKGQMAMAGQTATQEAMQRITQQSGEDILGGYQMLQRGPLQAFIKDKVENQ